MGFTRFYKLKVASDVCPPIIAELEKEDLVVNSQFVGKLFIVCKESEDMDEVLEVAVSLEQLQFLKQQIEDYVAKIQA